MRRINPVEGSDLRRKPKRVGKGRSGSAEHRGTPSAREGVFGYRRRKKGSEAEGAGGHGVRPAGAGGPEGARARWDSALGPRRGPRRAAERGKEGAEAAPWRRAGAPGARCFGGSPGSRRGGDRARRRERGGRDTHKFLGFAAVAARRRQLIRAPTLLLVPGPAAGPQAPAGRLHVPVGAGH